MWLLRAKALLSAPGSRLSALESRVVGGWRRAWRWPNGAVIWHYCRLTRSHIARCDLAESCWPGALFVSLVQQRHDLHIAEAIRSGSMCVCLFNSNLRLCSVWAFACATPPVPNGSAQSIARAPLQLSCPDAKSLQLGNSTRSAGARIPRRASGRAKVCAGGRNLVPM